MKILHVMQSVAPSSGGPIEGVRQLFLYATSADSIHAAVSNPLELEIASLDKASATYLSFPGCIVYPQRISWFDSIFPVGLVFWLSKNIKLYDVVVVNAIWDWHLVATWLVLRFHRKPYVVFTHGHLDPWFKRKYPLKHIKKCFFWPWAFYLPLKDADAVVFTCQKERYLARQSFRPYRCKEVVLSYGTGGIPYPEADYKSSFLSRHPTLQHRRCFLFLGRVHPKKGPDLLLRAIAELQDNGLWNPLQHCLVMAGPFDGPYAKHLRSLSEQLYVATSVYWTGMLLGDDKWGAFQSAEVFVLPSHQENFGIAVVEALSTSTPVLITHAVNISPEIVADSAGFADDDTVDGIIGLLATWLQLDHPSRNLMALKARQCYEDRYTIKGYFNELKALYSELLLRHNGTS